MNCDWVQQNITLYLYNELADDAHHELEQHVTRCTDCAAELAAQQQFQTAMSVLPVEEVSPSFLAAARMKLQESLEQVQPHRAWYHRLAFDPQRGCGRCGSRRRWHRSSLWLDLAAASAPCIR